MLAASSPLHNAVQSPQFNGWKASLDLTFCRSEHRTTLRFKHLGPLRIQKALYPDGQGCCHAVIVHPPGGIAGGDQLNLNIDVGPSAHALVTTPAATKWYGTFDDAVASQTIQIKLSGRLEWLPAETIVFDHANVRSRISIKAEKSASMLGWDLLIFGRQGSAEDFTLGQFEQWLAIEFEDGLVWLDRLSLKGSDPLLESPVGFNGNRALSCLWAIAPSDEPWSDELVDQLRHNFVSIAATRLHPRLLVIRHLGDPIELQLQLKKVWQWLKKNVWLLDANDLRLWAT